MATKEKIYTLLEILKLIEEAKRLGVDADGNALWGTPSEVYTQPLFLNRFTDDENTISSWHDITYPRNNLYYVKFKDMPKYLLDEYTNNQRHLYKDDKRINKDNIDPETWLVFDSSGHRITTEEDKYLREKYGEDYLDKYGKVIKDNPEWFFDYRDPRDIYAENNNLIPYKDGVIYNTFEQYNDQQENSEWEPWRPNLDTSDDSKENQQSIDNLFKPQRSLTLPITEGVEEGIQNIYPTHNGESKLVAGAGIIPNSYLPDLNFAQVPQTSYEDFDPSSIPTIFIPSQDKRFGLNFNLKDYDWSDLDEDEAIYLGRRKSNDFYKYLLPYLFSDLREKPFARPKEDGIKIRMSADGGQLNLFEKGSKVRSKYKSDNDWELMYELSKPIYQQFIDAGIDPIIATGVLGNIALESSFNPKASNRTHWGYVLNDRSLTDYVTSNYGGYGPEQQIQYLIDGLTKGIKSSDKGKGKAIQKRFTNFLNAAKGVTNPADIAKLWDDYYEISGGLALYDRRNYATKFWDKYNVPLIQETTYLESPLLLQYSQPALLQQNTTDVLINPLVKQPIYLTQQQPSTQQLAIMMAEPDLYTTELADVDLMKELFEPLGIKHTNKTEENPEEHNYKIKLSFDEGGLVNLDKDAIMSDYDTWVNYLILKKPYLRGEDFYNDNTYNYRAFFEESPEEAYKMLLDDEEAHFTDSYKTVNHPTFSTESNYSGYVNEYNPNGIEGGTWSETEPWTYTFSPSQIANNWNIPNTIDYVNDAENNGVTLYMPDGTLPKYAPIPFALDDNYFGGVLPNIIVENANGGPLNIYKGGTNNLKLSNSTRRLLLSLPSNPRSLLRTKMPVAQSDVTGRINIDKKQEQARRTNTKKVIGAAARRRAALDSYRYGDNNIGYRYRQAQAEKDPEGYMEQANAIDEARALELHTFINQETRTPLQIAVDHEKFLKNAEHEKRAEEKAKADEHLGAFMNLFKILSPSYQLGAARGVYEGNNYIDALYGDLNAGLPTFLLGQYSGKGFEEQYPLTTFGINFATDWAATKGIGAIPNAASKASNVSKLSNIAKVSRASEAGPKGFPLFGGRRFYTYKQFQNNPSWYYRVGKDLAKYAEDLGVITGKMSEAPFFSKGEALTSKGLNRDIIVHKGNGNYDWANLDVEGNVTLNPRTWVDDMTGLTRMWNDVTNKPVGPTEVTPLVNGKAGVANPADFTVFRPFNIFGKNFGYIERSLGQSKSTFNISGMQDTFRKVYNNSKTSNNLNANVLQTQPAFTQDLFGMNYTGYQMPKMFDINLSYLPRGFAVGPVLDTNDIVNLPTIITADNKLVTPSRWDTLQQRAISAGDLQELQKLRDYHFIELALNNNFFFPTSDTLNPATLRHVVADEYNPNFNIFDPTIEGTNSFIYTTDSVPMASSYFSKPITVRDVAKFRDYYGNLWKEGLQLRLEGFRKTLADIQEAENNGFNSLTDYYKNIGKQGYLTYSPSNSLPLTKLRTIFEQNFNTTLNDLINFLEYLNNQLAARGFNTPNPERMKTLYGALNNPVVLDANNRFWSNVGDYNINGTLYGSGSTRNVEHNIMFNHPDIDGFILNRVKDYGGRRQFGNWDPASVIGFRYPNLLKYKAGITYDDNGIIIPLSKRDNFELGDLRYSLGGNLKIK